MAHDSSLTAFDGVSLVRALMAINAAVAKLSVTLPPNDQVAVLQDLKTVGEMIDTLIASLEAK